MPEKSNRKNLFVRQYLKLVAATAFLSTLPLPGSRFLVTLDATDVLLGGEYFPLVGLLLSGVLWLLILLCAPLVPQLLLAAFLVVALVLLTGGLHLDGLMDTCDGLFGGFTRERKLEIMRDSRVGSFGVLGGICVLLLKFACLASLHEPSLPVALLVTLPSSRWGLVLCLRAFPAARTTGLGATFRQTVTLPTLVIAGVFTLIIVLVSAHLAGLLVWGAVTLTSLALSTWITRQLGGLTGDTYGAIAEIAEIIGFILCILLHF